MAAATEHHHNGACAAAASAASPSSSLDDVNKQQQQQQQAAASAATTTTRVLTVDRAALEAACGSQPNARFDLPANAAAGAAPPALAAALDALHEAGAALRAGALVAVPTETVYGLAANALDEAAVARIFAAKGRPADNPLIVHVSDLRMLRQLYYPPQPSTEAGGSSSGGDNNGDDEGIINDLIPEAYRAAVAAHWPGPLTILLPASPLIPRNVTAGHATVAVRMPSHPVARAAIAAAGVPLAAPSANSSGRPSPTTASHVVSDLAGAGVPLVLDGGACDCGLESTVLDALRAPPAVLRPGGVSVEALAALGGPLSGLRLHGREFRDAKLERAPTTPGMKYAHYAPRPPVTLVEPPPPPPVTAEDASGAAAAAAAAVAAVAEAALRAVKEQQQRHGRARVALLRTTLPVGTPVGWQQQSWAQEGGGGSSGEAAGCHREYCLGPMADPAQVGRALFAALRAAEAEGADAIVAEGVADAGGGAAVMNRLRKAAASVVHAAAAAL